MEDNEREGMQRNDRACDDSGQQLYRDRRPFANGDNNEVSTLPLVEIVKSSLYTEVFRNSSLAQIEAASQQLPSDAVVDTLPIFP
jgi:hypothetical protein